MKRFLAFTTLMILTACATATESPTPTVVPSNTPPPTATSTDTPAPTITPSPTLSPTATEILTTPDFETLPIAENFLFAPSSDPDCQLPCWQGLRIGESNREDVQRMFQEVFGFKGELAYPLEAFPFDDDPYPLVAMGYSSEAFPDLMVTGHDWYWENGTIFHIYLWLHRETDLLAGIFFPYSPPPGITEQAFQVPTLHQVFRELGAPSYIVVDPAEPDMRLVDLLANDNAPVATPLFLLYEQGMTFFMDSGAYYDLDVLPDETIQINELCFMEDDDMQRIVILPPFDDGLDNLTTLQEMAIGYFLFESDKYKSVEDVFGVDTETFVQIFLENDGCVPVKR